MAITPDAIAASRRHYSRKQLYLPVMPTKLATFISAVTHFPCVTVLLPEGCNSIATYLAAARKGWRAVRQEDRDLRIRMAAFTTARDAILEGPVGRRKGFIQLCERAGVPSTPKSYANEEIKCHEWITGCSKNFDYSHITVTPPDDLSSHCVLIGNDDDAHPDISDEIQRIMDDEVKVFSESPALHLWTGRHKEALALGYIRLLDSTGKVHDGEQQLYTNKRCYAISHPPQPVGVRNALYPGPHNRTSPSEDNHSRVQLTIASFGLALASPKKRSAPAAKPKTKRRSTNTLKDQSTLVFT